MSLDFTAIDFETANSYRGSPCSVGLTRVRSGNVVDEVYTLIRPPEPYSHFDGFNVSIHGIHAEDVRHSPSWTQALRQITSFVGNDVVVAHNAGFDMGVIRHACIADRISWPAIDYLCTLVLARRAYSLPSYRLPFVAAECGVTLAHHHLASDDARSAAEILVAMARSCGLDTVKLLAEHFGVRVGHMEADTWVGSACIQHYRPSAARYGLVLPVANPKADPEHPLYGRVIVFTGAMTSMTRQVAWDAVSQAGGIPACGVTRQTNILVTGDINLAVLAPGMTTTGKTAKAFTRQRAGQQIEVMTEDDFLRSL